MATMSESVRDESESDESVSIPTLLRYCQLSQAAYETKTVEMGPSGDSCYVQRRGESGELVEISFKGSLHQNQWVLNLCAPAVLLASPAALSSLAWTGLTAGRIKGLAKDMNLQVYCIYTYTYTPIHL
jgi:hypothetical protein